MRKGLLTIALVALIAATAAWSAPVEKPEINPELSHKGVFVQPLDSRATLVQADFEDVVPPAGWTTMTTGASYGWAQSTSNANSGAASAWVRYGSSGAFQDEWLITPALDATGYNTLTLEFAEAESYWADWGLEHNIMVSTTVPDDPAAFTNVVTMTPGNHTITSWQMTSIDLSAYAGMSNIYVAIRYQGDYADDWYIDDLRIFEPYEHDVKVSSVDPANSIAFPGVDFTPMVTVENVGQNTETFEVSMVVTFDGVSMEGEVITVTDLAVGQSADVAFSPFTTQVGNYVLTAEAMLVGDMDPENDHGAGLVTCWDQERTPFSILYTEWGCGPCVSANQALDALYPTMGNDAALMRVHVWWPAGTDPMYHANPTEVEFLHAMTPTTVNGVPTPYFDNILDAWDIFDTDWPNTFPIAFGMSEAIPAPLGVQLGYNEETGNVEVFVDVVNNLQPNGNYRLYVAVTEDGIEALGPNGEPVHNQTFRDLVPGADGIVIDTALGMDMYEVPLALDPTWVYENLRAVAWVQDMPTGMVMNCGTVFLTEGVVGIDDNFVEEEVEVDNTPSLATRVAGAHPNPFNPMTTIEFSVARTQHVTLSVYNMSGQRVANLVDGVYEAGQHPVQWNGTDSSGRGVASGTYLVHMQSDDGVSASKIMLVR